VFNNSLEAGLVSQHVAVCRVSSAVFHPRFLLWGLRGTDGQEQLLGSKYGQGKPGLNLKQIGDLSMPCPPIELQERIVDDLDAIQAKVDAASALQVATAAEIDALLPSILDKAFKGHPV
jgi:type I restriction enzyme S subunit